MSKLLDSQVAPHHPSGPIQGAQISSTHHHHKANSGYKLDERFVRAITIGMIEVLYGIRSPNQLARWLSDKTFRDLERRAALVRQQLSTGGSVNRAPFAIASVMTSHLQQDRVSSVAIVKFPGRARAVALEIVELPSGRPRIEALILI